MLGQIDPNQKKVHIVGGGISGLISAYRLDRLGYEVYLYEKSDRLGGLVDTESGVCGPIEKAAHSLLASPPVIEFFEEIQLPVFQVTPGAKKFIYREGKWHRMPLRVSEVFQTLRSVLKKKAPSIEVQSQWSLSDFAQHFFGRAVDENLLTPMIRGIYAAEPSEILLKCAYPQWEVPRDQTFLGYQRKKRKEGKSKVGRPIMVSPKKGMGQLVSVLSDHVQKRLGSRVFFKSELERLPKDGNIVLCIPAQAASDLLEDQSFELSEALSSVRYAPLVVATVFVRKESLLRVPEGVGILSAGQGTIPCLGILFNSSSFANRVVDSEYSSLSVFLGGTREPDLVQESSEALKDRAIAAVNQVIGLTSKATEVVVHAYPKAIPIYDAYLAHVWDVANRSWCRGLGRVLASNYSGDISIRSMIERWQEIKVSPTESSHRPVSSLNHSPGTGVEVTRSI